MPRAGSGLNPCAGDEQPGLSRISGGYAIARGWMKVVGCNGYYGSLGQHAPSPAFLAAELQHVVEFGRFSLQNAGVEPSGSCQGSVAARGS